MSVRGKRVGKLVSAIMVGGFLVTVAVLLLRTPVPVEAWEVPCDFLTGGGYIIHKGAKANFGVGGGCKVNGPNAPFWGHLNYLDHGTAPAPQVVPPPFHVHATSITDYRLDDVDDRDPKTGQPRGKRVICGKARTNHPLYPEVDFAVAARDAGEPGVNDEFDIRLCSGTVNIYDTTAECNPHFLGSSCAPGNGGGGNIQLHKPNRSTMVEPTGSCPASVATCTGS